MTSIMVPSRVKGVNFVGLATPSIGLRVGLNQKTWPDISERLRC